MKRIALFGSTGSIGVNTLNVVREHPDRFSVTCLTAHTNVHLLAKQARELNVKQVAVPSIDVYDELRGLLQGSGTEILCGENALSTLAREADYDIMVAAIVGSAGLLPTLEAVRRGKIIALANKETLVCGGELVKKDMAGSGAQIIPVDSEHSALFQCLVGEERSSVERILLTASGGPFFKLPKEQFPDITVERALQHPNWTMGSKITIDSATLMNKGLEVIEAHWLFDMPASRIHVLVHPQSIIHSMIEFVDGSVKAQLGLPDMKLPIQYALTYPDRLVNGFGRVDFSKTPRFDFFDPDTEKFPCLGYAYEALEAGGTTPAVLNAANEALVGQFLKQEITFTDIPAGIDAALQAHDPKATPQLEEIIQADRWAREFATRLHPRK